MEQVAPKVDRCEHTLLVKAAVNCQTQSDWLALTLELLGDVGFAVIEDVLDSKFLQETRSAMYEVERLIELDVGRDKLDRAGELGVLRLMMKYHDHFYRFLEIPEMLSVVDATVSPTAILHLQNGLLLPAYEDGATPRVAQNTFHMDFRRVLDGYMASINCLFAIDEFREDNGATLAVPGSHQRTTPPSLAYMNFAAVPVVCPAGSMLLFDSTLWHAAGANTSGQDRLAVNHQFTRSFFKQQVDYPRALGEEAIKRQLERTQQVLGWHTRVPAGMHEFYVPGELRYYRSGQG